MHELQRGRRGERRPRPHPRRLSSHRSPV